MVHTCKRECEHTHLNTKDIPGNYEYNITE